MNNEEFIKLLKQLQEKELKILDNRATVYSTQSSRFHNFEEISLITGYKPALCAFMLMLKHFVALKDFMMKYSLRENCNISQAEFEKLEEFVVDMRNYLSLIYAMFYEVILYDEG